MPFVNLQITAGTTREQRERVVAEFTATLVRVLGKKPEHTHIVIQEVAEDYWGFAGLLTDEFRRPSSRASASGGAPPGTD